MRSILKDTSSSVLVKDKTEEMVPQDIKIQREATKMVCSCTYACRVLISIQIEAIDNCVIDGSDIQVLINILMYLYACNVYITTTIADVCIGN